MSVQTIMTEVHACDATKEAWTQACPKLGGTAAGTRQAQRLARKQTVSLHACMQPDGASRARVDALSLCCFQHAAPAAWVPELWIRYLEQFSGGMTDGGIPVRTQHGSLAQAHGLARLLARARLYALRRLRMCCASQAYACTWGAGSPSIPY